MSCDIGEVTESLENELCSTVYSTVYSSAHSPSVQSLHLRHSSFWFSKLSVTSPTSQLILQPFRCFYLQHSSFSNPSISLPTSQLILQPFPRFYLHHSSFSNPSIALPTPQLILQSFRCFTYVTAHSPTLLLLLLCHRIFTYFTWRAAHGTDIFKKTLKKSLIMAIMLKTTQQQSWFVSPWIWLEYLTLSVLCKLNIVIWSESTTRGTSTRCRMANPQENPEQAQGYIQHSCLALCLFLRSETYCN